MTTEVISGARRRPHGPYPALRPTLVFAGGFALALGIHQWMPLPIAKDGGFILSTLGALLMAGGLLLFVWALVLFSRARTGIMFHSPARRLMMRGPYSWSRNPQYVSFAAIYIGGAFVMNTAWPLAVLPIVLVAVNIGVIAAEERYLRTTFGPAYDEYCRQVRRWL